VESINYKNVLCIGPSGNSGRATACKSFIYNLLIQKINVSWKPIKIDSTTEGTSELDAKVTKVKNALLKYSEVVICSQPKNWNSLIDSNRISNDKTIIGKFSSDIDEINEENIAFINESKINILSVLNQEVFDKLNGRINKTIIVEKLSYVVDKRSVDYKAFDNN
jgi:Glu-tRNA(Gln) amidotransferase subunit E-like FAD-binding protein